MNEIEPPYVQPDPIEAFKQEEANMASFLAVNAIPYEAPEPSDYDKPAARAARLLKLYDRTVVLPRRWAEVEADGEQEFEAAIAAAAVDLQTTFPGRRFDDFRPPAGLAQLAAENPHQADLSPNPGVIPELDSKMPATIVPQNQQSPAPAMAQPTATFETNDLTQIKLEALRMILAKTTDPDIAQSVYEQIDSLIAAQQTGSNEHVRVEADILPQRRQRGSRATAEQATTHGGETEGNAYSVSTDILKRIVSGLRRPDVGVPASQSSRPKDSLIDDQVVSQTMDTTFGKNLWTVAA